MREMLCFGLSATRIWLFSQSGTTPLALAALLLFKEPPVYEIRTLLAFVALGDRSHREHKQQPPYSLLYLCLSDFIQADSAICVSWTRSFQYPALSAEM